MSNLEKTNELAESVKQTAHDVSVKAVELEKSAENKLAEAANFGKYCYKTIRFPTHFFQFR